MKLYREIPTDEDASEVVGAVLMWVAPVERCEHTDDEHPNGYLDSHWVPVPSKAILRKECLGVRVNGADNQMEEQ